MASHCIRLSIQIDKRLVKKALTPVDRDVNGRASRSGELVNELGGEVLALLGNLALDQCALLHERGKRALHGLDEIALDLLRNSLAASRNRRVEVAAVQGVGVFPALVPVAPSVSVSVPVGVGVHVPSSLTDSCATPEGPGSIGERGRLTAVVQANQAGAAGSSAGGSGGDLHGDGAVGGPIARRK